MEHLNRDVLARLVDESPTAAERSHLDRCGRCRDESEALRAQTEALGDLPAVRPPQGEWDALEPRLREEGLLGSSAPEKVAGTGGGERWPRLAAMAATLVLGMGIGVGASSLGAPTDEAVLAGGAEPTPLQLLAADPDRVIDRMTTDEAAELVRLTEEWYLASLLRYQERVQPDLPEVADPIGRYAAIEALMAAGQAAVREAPTDPFLNGLLLNMHAERERTIRGLEARRVGDNWY
jgi:hypothetical protein